MVNILLTLKIIDHNFTILWSFITFVNQNSVLSMVRYPTFLLLIQFFLQFYLLTLNQWSSLDLPCIYVIAPRICAVGAFVNNNYKFQCTATRGSRARNGANIDHYKFPLGALTARAHATSGQRLTRSNPIEEAYAFLFFSQWKGLLGVWYTFTVTTQVSSASISILHDRNANGDIFLVVCH